MTNQLDTMAREWVEGHDRSDGAWISSKIHAEYFIREVGDMMATCLGIDTGIEVIVPSVGKAISL